MTETREAMAEATAMATPSTAPEGESIASQTTRGRARTREAEPTTTATTESDADTPQKTPEWAARAGRYARRQLVMNAEPVPPGELWERVSLRASHAEGWLPTAWVYLGGGIGYLLTAALLGVAWIAHQPFGGGPLQSLNELWDQIDNTADTVEGRNTARAVRTAGRIGWGVCAACYALTYVIQFPALLAVLASCGGIAFLTSLF